MGLFAALVASLLATSAAHSIKHVEKSQTLLVDVREHDEVQKGTLPGALILPLSTFERDESATVEKLKHAAKGRAVHLFCRSGRRSGLVRDILAKHGVKAENIGGYEDLMRAWSARP